jgi:hypothetical protein
LEAERCQLGLLLRRYRDGAAHARRNEAHHALAASADGTTNPPVLVVSVACFASAGDGLADD